MRDGKGVLFTVILILLISSVFFFKNFIFAVRIEDGKGFFLLDYIGFLLLILSIFFFTGSITVAVSVFLSFNLFDSLMLFANRLYYRYFGDYISLDIFSLASNIPFTWANVISLIKFKDLLIFLDIPILLVFFSLTPKKFRIKSNKRLILATFLFLASFAFPLFNMWLLHRTLPNVLTFRYGSSMLFNSMSPHNFYLLNLYEVIIRREARISYSPVLSEEIKLGELELAPEFKINQKLYNIIMIEFESLGVELIQKKIKGQEIMPTFNQIAKMGIYFKNFYSQALTSSGTLDVEFSALTSFYPSPTSPYPIKYAHKVPFSLPRFLSENGYHTMFFHANRGAFYRRSAVMRILGFKELYFSDYFLSPERKYRGISDYPFFMECAEIIKRSKKPFFAYLVTLSSHTPFDLPKGEKPGLEIEDTELDPITKKYYQVFNYVDRAFKAFMDSLSEKSILNETILILFGDHPRYTTERKGVREIVEESMNKRVPFIILIPNAKRKVMDEPSSHADISPTILSILGLKYHGVLLGRNLLSSDNKGFVIINRNPVILIKKENIFWGYLEKGFTNSLNGSSEKELMEANRLLDILKFSEYVLKK